MKQYLKSPFPYFGGKTKVAPDVWQALGQPKHYIEPFCGSCAVLLLRPDWTPDMMETVNDADGHIANVWRSLKWSPDETAEWCDWPVNHADLIARKAELNMNTDILLENLCADSIWHDPKMAGYYIWAASCWIGSGLVCPKQIPNISGTGKGVHAKGKRPRIYEWFDVLRERLRGVRVVCGDWTRVCGGKWQTNIGICGMFFDPPYSNKATRMSNLYAVDSESVAHDVRDWCAERGDNEKMRIVLAGYYEEHEELQSKGWTVKRWKAQGGYASLGDKQGKKNRHREALFFSPHCVGKDDQRDLFG